MRAEFLVQRRDHVADLQVLGLVHRLGELVPEGVHHLPPVQLAGGDVVQLLLQRGGEAGIDVVLEEADQEGGDQPAAILRDEAPLLQPDIVAVLQHRQDGRIGGRPANAQFLHLLHQRRFGVARRRLGEMLQRVHPARASADRARPSAAACGCRLPPRRPRRCRRCPRDTASGSRRTRRSSRWRAASAPLPSVTSTADLVQLGRLHLRGDGALPHQLIQPALVGAQFAAPPESGVRVTSVGRIASCASWAFLILLWYSRGAAGR